MQTKSWPQHFTAASLAKPDKRATASFANSNGFAKRRSTLACARSSCQGRCLKACSVQPTSLSSMRIKLDSTSKRPANHRQHLLFHTLAPPAGKSDNWTGILQTATQAQPLRTPGCRSFHPQSLSSMKTHRRSTTPYNITENSCDGK